MWTSATVWISMMKMSPILAEPVHRLFRPCPEDLSPTVRETGRVLCNRRRKLSVDDRDWPQRVNTNTHFACAKLVNGEHHSCRRAKSRSYSSFRSLKILWMLCMKTTLRSFKPYGDKIIEGEVSPPRVYSFVPSYRGSILDLVLLIGI